MSITHARTFVERLKEDYDFRNKALTTSGTEELVAFLQTENLVFTQRELVGAMSECMEQQELQAEIGS